MYNYFKIIKYITKYIKQIEINISKRERSIIIVEEIKTEQI